MTIAGFWTELYDLKLKGLFCAVLRIQLWEAIAVIQKRNEGAWNQNGTSKFGEQWEDSSSILKVEPIELDGLDRGLDKKQAMKDGANVMN